MYRYSYRYINIRSEVTIIELEQPTLEVMVDDIANDVVKCVTFKCTRVTLHFIAGFPGWTVIDCCGQGSGFYR